MSNLNDLIARVCPGGVEYKALGSIATVVRGASPRPIQKYLTDDADGIPWIKIGDTSPEDKYITKTAQKVTPEGAKSSRFVEPGYFILSNSMSFGRPYISKIHGCIHDGWLSISDFESSMTSDYLYHVLSSANLQKEMSQRANSGAMKNLNADIVKALMIPVPPIEVQEEIVRLLDTFVDLSAGLQREIADRKKQYQYYRDVLFDFERNGIEHKKLTVVDVCVSVTSGGTPKSTVKEYYDGNIPWLRTQEVDWADIYDTGVKITQLGYDNSSAKMIKENCVIVAMYGATAGKVAINKIPLCTNQACCNLEIDSEKALFEYVYYCLCKDYLLLKGKGQGSQYNINAGIVKAHPICIPSLEVQRELVEKVQIFTTAIESLQAEYDLRLKQFEYYRDKLLTFNEES